MELNELLEMQESMNPKEEIISKMVDMLEDLTHYEKLSILSSVKKKLIEINKESIGSEIKSSINKIKGVEPYEFMH